MKKAFLLVMLSLLGVLNESKASEVEKPSMIQLIANPERYDGKVVFVHGYLSIGQESSAIFLTEEHAKNRIFTNAISIKVPKDLAEKAKALNGKWVVVQGVFDQKERGMYGLFQGSIRDLTRLDARLGKANSEGQKPW